ncbi:MAG: hypothetical protein QG652_51 [Pseudomonadota bacterium]|nr:hypothetical protein [Pseudomonadota bacterium]
MRLITKWLMAGLVCLTAFNVLAEDITRDQIKGLDEQVQDIKKDVIDLTSELSRLEEKLLFPSSTQVSIFISLGEADSFRLDTVQVKLDDAIVAHHLYNFRELEALQKGGVQKIYVGNIKTGDHELVVSFAGKAPAGGDLQRSASYKLNKDVGPKFVEVRIAGTASNAQEIQFKDW